MNTQQFALFAFLGSLAGLITGCSLRGSSAPAAPAAPLTGKTSAGSMGVECSPIRFPGSYSGNAAGDLLLSVGEKPMLSRQFTGPQPATVELIQDGQEQLVLKLAAASPAVQCELKFKCLSASFAQFEPDQQCVYNFSALSPAHTEDVVFELLKGEGSVNESGVDLRLEWKAKSRRGYDRATGRLSIDLAVGTLEQKLNLSRR